MLDMADVDIPLKDYRSLLSELARRHIRVMGVEGASRSLVGPHLPPNVTGGTPVNPAPGKRPLETRLPTAEQPKAERPKKPASGRNSVIDAPVRSGQSISNLEGDVTVVGRVAQGRRSSPADRCMSMARCRGESSPGVSGARDARIFCREARAELLCIGGALCHVRGMDSKIEGRSVEVRMVEGEIKIRILE